MYWPSKLRRALGFGPKATLPYMFSGECGLSRAYETLLGNPAVHGDQAIVDCLIRNGETVFFRQGENIIRQDGQDNSVYFLLSGVVDIVFKSQKGSIREAPNQVGEMAAIEPGKGRSASVVARSDEVAALKVSGTEFKKLLNANPRFQEILQVEMSARHRERIVAGDIARRNNSVTWFAISTGAGLIAGLAGWYVLTPSDWTTTARSILSCGLGLIIFLLTLLHNPAFFWRRSFGVVLLAMIGTFALDWFVSMEAKQGLGSLQVAMNLGNEKAEWEMQLVKAVLYFLVLGLCALMDSLRARD